MDNGHKISVSQHPPSTQQARRKFLVRIRVLSNSSNKTTTLKSHRPISKVTKAVRMNSSKCSHSSPNNNKHLHCSNPAAQRNNFSMAWTPDSNSCGTRCQVSSCSLKSASSNRLSKHRTKVSSPLRTPTSIVASNNPAIHSLTNNEINSNKTSNRLTPSNSSNCSKTSLNCLSRKLKCSHSSSTKLFSNRTNSMLLLMATSRPNLKPTNSNPSSNSSLLTTGCRVN